MNPENFDVIVVGAGHAGTEAAFAAANLGSKVLLLATSLQCVAMMPCNPSVGGPGKGHLVREIHALGGQMGKQVDATYLQIRILNESKGPAVQALRAQSDKVRYHLHVKSKLEEHQNITLIQGEAIALLHNNQSVYGVRIITGIEYHASSVILCTGTFLNGHIILGHSKTPGGPSGNTASIHLSDSIRELGIRIHRLQTATPPRIAGQSIDFSKMKPMPGDPGILTFTKDISRQKQRHCYLTHTTMDTVNAVKENLKDSPLKIGNITQHGPKHCPSIDRKVIRFPEIEMHHIFVEPESDFHDEWYLLGLTTSMPPEAQEAVVHSVPGLENARIVRYGYAIEYDAIDATQLKKSMEFKMVANLFTAGQINGTSGYEEAAAQGLIAGINAHNKAHKKPPFVLKSTTSYLAEMVDELVTNPRNEPLRVTTSSSEFRLHLRSDNAEERLTAIGYELGLIPKARYEFEEWQKQIVNQEVESLKNTLLRPTREVLAKLHALKSSSFKNTISLANLLSREEIRYRDLKHFGYPCISQTHLISKIETRVKYDFFLQKLKRRMEHADELDSLILNEDIYYAGIEGLSQGTKEKIESVKPFSVGQASKIAGISSAEIAILIHACKQGLL